MKENKIIVCKPWRVKWVLGIDAKKGEDLLERAEAKRLINENVEIFTLKNIEDFKKFYEKTGLVVTHLYTTNENVENAHWVYFSEIGSSESDVFSKKVRALRGQHCKNNFSKSCGFFPHNNNAGEPKCGPISNDIESDEGNVLCEDVFNHDILVKTKVQKIEVKDDGIWIDSECVHKFSENVVQLSDGFRVRHELSGFTVKEQVEFVKKEFGVRLPSARGKTSLLRYVREFVGT